MKCTRASILFACVECRTLLTTKAQLAVELERIRTFEAESRSGAAARSVTPEQYKHALKSERVTRSNI